MTTLEEALAFVARAETAQPVGWLGELGSTLRASAQGASAELAVFLLADAHACEFFLDPSFENGGRRVPFEPWRPELFDDSVRPYLEARAEQ
jgi:hypothetical protein